MAMALRVTYKTALDGELRAWMTQQLIKYLLFMRGQIPCLYDEFRQNVERSKQLQQQKAPRRRKLPMNGGTKRAVKCVEAAECLFGGQLDAIFARKVQRVALVFGSSMMSPREVVIIDFNVNAEVAQSPPDAESPQTEEEDMSLDDSHTLSPSSPPMSREKLMRLCSQKLIRALFAHTMDQFSNPLPTTQLHIAVLAERQATPIPGFHPKQQFKLRLPREKCVVRTHCVIVCDGVNADGQTERMSLQLGAGDRNVTLDTNTSLALTITTLDSENQPLKACASDAMWYVLKTPIPGVSGLIDTLATT